MVVAMAIGISDVASAILVKRFYRYLSEGKSKPEALRQAQLITRRYYPHPRFWAPFRLLGATD